MKYICTKRYKGHAIQGKDVNISYSTDCHLDGESIKYDGNIICFANSLIGHKHFARDDDGNGLKRGKLTYAIAFATRKRKHSLGLYRFSAEEIDLLERKYKKYLKDNETIIFDDNFFHASIDELEEMAQSLNIKIDK